MSRGIVVGVTWYVHGERIERVSAGPDAHTRTVIDRLVAAAPNQIRKDLATYLAPLLEKNEPSQAGIYDCRVGSYTFYAWWKRAHILETP